LFLFRKYIGFVNEKHNTPSASRICFTRFLTGVD
jgi:hypothetical protein